MASEQIQRGCKRAMERHATAIKAGRRRHKWTMVQATAMVMHRKGSSFYNSIINGPKGRHNYLPQQQCALRRILSVRYELIASRSLC